MSIATTQQPLCEGKTKRFFATDNPNEVIAVFKDDATAFNAQKHAVIEGKGAINATVSRILFEAVAQAACVPCARGGSGHGRGHSTAGRGAPLRRDTRPKAVVPDGTHA